jgi:hypothetical protein
MVLPCLLGLCRHPLSSSPRSTCSRVGLPPTIKRKCQNRIQFVKQANESEREKVAPYLLGLEVVEDTVEDQLGGHQLITCVDLTRNPTLQDIEEQSYQLPELQESQVDIAVCGDMN